MNSQRRHSLGLALFMAAALPLASHANSLVNGGFESQPNFGAGISGDSGYSALTGAQIPGWTIEAGHAATVHNTVIYPFISGSYSINMDGEGYLGRNANLYQDFASSSGVGYALDYDWQTWFTDTTPKLNVSITDTVTLALLYQGNFSVGVDGVVHHVTASFTGTGHALRLRVSELPESGYNDNAFIVDNFAVNAVPEAATWVLMAGGLGALGLARWRLNRPWGNAEQVPRGH